MKSTASKIVVAAVMLASLAFADAGSPGVEVGTDPSGDANLLNGQGFVTGLPSQSTSPLSYDRADLVAARFATEFATVPVGDDGLSVVPTGVRFDIETAGAPGSDGPTMIFRINATINGCRSFINAFLDNPVGPPAGTSSGTVQWRQLDAFCPDGVATVTNAGWTATIEGNVLSISMPYETMTAAQEGFLTKGSEIGSGTVETRTEFWVGAGTLTAPMLDTMSIASFTIGWDLPPSRACTSGC